jgi:hypothetical protein
VLLRIPGTASNSLAVSGRALAIALNTRSLKMRKAGTPPWSAKTPFRLISLDF